MKPERRWPNLNVRDHPCHIPRTVIRGFNSYRCEVLNWGFALWELHLGVFHGGFEDGGHLTGYADDTEAIRTIGCKVKLNKGV